MATTRLIEKRTPPIRGVPPAPDAAWRQAFRRRLRKWYATAARDLPWRRTRKVYPIWVSEIMLQQTQVQTVGPYFQRFVKTFPTIARLAAADEQQVLRMWEGLGYYRRARQLHAAAQQIVERHGGRFPRTIEAVRALPGIGRYTAGAILSIAYDDRHPILEANTVRLLARLLAYGEPLASDKARQPLWQLATDLLPRTDVGQFNQALMELGSLVCTPKSPRCDECPVAALCRTSAAGLQDFIPAAKKKVAFEQIREIAVVAMRNGRVLLRRCGPDERWAGLWDFPRVAADSGIAAERGARCDIADKVVTQTGVRVRLGKKLTTIKHGVTRYRITLDCYRARVVGASARANANVELKWVRPAELDGFPLSTTGRKIARLVVANSDSS